MSHNANKSQDDAQPQAPYAGAGLPLPYATTPREVLDNLPGFEVTSRHIALQLDVKKFADTLYKYNSPRTVGNCLILRGPFTRDTSVPPPAAKVVNVEPPLDADGFAAAEPLGSSSASSSSSLFSSESSGSSDSYMVLFKYGSVVCFNMDRDEQAFHIAKIREACDPSSLLPTKSLRYDDTTLKVYPDLDEASRMMEGYMVLRTLDAKNVTVISSVMAQSVAMDHYSSSVDEMVRVFMDLNSAAGKGMFSKADKQQLFRLVSEQNTVFLDLIVKLGILERSEVAWKNAENSAVWEALRYEFELDSRFRRIDFKLNLIQHNTKYFLEIMHNQKSDKLEWTIIVLIAVEIAVSLADMADANPVGLLRSIFT